MRRVFLNRILLTMLGLTGLVLLLFALGLKPFVRSAARRDAQALLVHEERRLAADLLTIEEAGRSIAAAWSAGELNPLVFESMARVQGQVQGLRVVSSLLVARSDGGTHVFQKKGLGWQTFFYQPNGSGMCSVTSFADGRVQGTVQKPYDPVSRPWFSQVRGKTQPMWIPAYRQVDGVPCISYSVPVWTADGKTQLGVVALDFELDGLTTMLENAMPTRRSQAVLVDDQGRVLAFRVAAGAGMLPASSPLYLESMARPEFSAFYQASGVAPTPPWHGGRSWWNREHLVFLAGVNSSQAFHWHQLVAIPKEELNLSPWGRLLPTLLVLFGFFAIAIWQFNRVIGDLTQPLANLAAQVQQRQSGPEPPAGGLAIQELRILEESLRQSWGQQAQRRALQDQVMQLERLQVAGTMASGVAHDLGNFLSAVHLNQDVVAELLPEDAPGRSHLAAAQSATDKASQLVRSLLGFCKKIQGDQDPVALDALVEHLKPLLLTLVKGKLDLTVTGAQGLPLILGNAAQLEQVLVNLVINARDATPDGGQVRIELALRDEVWVEMRVADSGSGMSAAVQERIFEPFFTTKPADQGTGLGLAMVYQIIENHGGHIQVDSELGQGTTFALRLPVLDPIAANDQFTAT